MISSSPATSITVSLTQFLDYAAAKDGEARATIVKRAKKQMDEGYSPHSDYYRQLRLAIQKADGTKIDLGDLNFSANRSDNFRQACQGWNRFVGRKSFEPKTVRRTDWTYRDLTVRINPELALRQNGVTTFYKLYFKDEKLLKRDTKPIYQMMTEMLELQHDEDVGIIDLRSGCVVNKPKVVPSPKLAAILRGDAESFITLWRTLPT